MTWHGYLAIEDINLNQAQRQTLWQVIQSKGANNNSPLPHFRNHWRLSLNNRKGIFEAQFRKDQLTIPWFTAALANIFNVDPDNITANTNHVTFYQVLTPVVTFSYNTTNYIRFAAFAGTAATWELSRLETAAYLAQNIEEWEEPDE